MRVVDFRRRAESLWIQVEVMSHSFCTSLDEPRVIARGWFDLVTPRLGGGPPLSNSLIAPLAGSLPQRGVPSRTSRRNERLELGCAPAGNGPLPGRRMDNRQFALNIVPWLSGQP